MLASAQQMEGLGVDFWRVFVVLRFFWEVGGLHGWFGQNGRIALLVIGSLLKQSLPLGLLVLRRRRSLTKKMMLRKQKKMEKMKKKEKRKMTKRLDPVIDPGQASQVIPAAFQQTSVKPQ